MKHWILGGAALLLAACSGHKPLPIQQAAVSVWDMAPATSQVRHSGGGEAFEFAILGPEKRGIASMRVHGVTADPRFLLVDFKSLDKFVVASTEGRFQCGTERRESGLEYNCTWRGKVMEKSPVSVVADGIEVHVPKQAFAKGQTVVLEWLEFWR